ncbi:MAG TPA: type VI secretion system-associated protein TagF [Dongiaceae bacterium]|nr:type VI secretion system-associated protein TagF [Dongiaceae bacterium]
MSSNSVPRCGFFGKLPGYGDFIERNLPRSFIEQWDTWLQQGMAGSRQALGEQWLDQYLTMPIWRFALSSGCTDGSAWLGILLPSVDRVGRYFPLTLAQVLPPVTALTPALLDNAAWFERLESIGLACLQETPTVEAVTEVLDNLPPPRHSRWHAPIGSSPAPGLCVTLHNADPSTASGDMSQRTGLVLLETLLRQKQASFSLWSAGQILLNSEHLPDPRGFAALLSGEWNIHGWQQTHWNEPC